MIQSTGSETEDQGQDGGDSLMPEEDDSPPSRDDASGNNNSSVLEDFLDEEFGGNESYLVKEEQQQQQQQQKGGFLEKDCGSMTVRALIGLGIAGLGGTLVADVFGMFYVDCFLRAYKLPMRVFGIGSAIFAVINTANDVAGAYLLDWYCSNNSSNPKKREDLVGLSGCLYALSVLVPFCRWGPRSSANANASSSMFWDGLHFVGSLSIYDTMFSFNCILQGSIVSDNHSMTESQRIAFFALRDMVGILAPLVVTKVGLSLFDVSNLQAFRIYVVILVGISSLLSGWGQALIHNHQGKDKEKSSSTVASNLLPAFLRAPNSSAGYSKVNREVSHEGGIDTQPKAIGDGDTFIEGGNSKSNSNDSQDSPRIDINTTESSNSSSSSSSRNLGFWMVVSDFAAHPNFRYWIGMEMLMEGQNTFMGNFQKTFVDQLLRNENSIQGGDGWSNPACDWMLALLDPATQIVGLLLFLPIKRYGYAVLYKMVFVTNTVMAVGLLLSNGFDNGDNNIFPIASFLFLSIALSNAMAGAGFGLAMCDMVLEMKHSHSVIQGRVNPPSLAGLFMGVNALFCKPAESVLPILAASFLGEGYNSNDDNGIDIDIDQDGTTAIASPEAKVVLYRLLVLPPLICSVLQLVLWSRYSLVPEKTEQLRAELKEYEQKMEKQQQQESQRHLYRDDGSEGSRTDIEDYSIIEMNHFG